MAKGKSPIVYLKPLYGRGTDGKRRKYGVGCMTADGNAFALLTPTGKGAKYAKEIRDGTRYTNLGVQKVNANGNPVRLTKAQRAYRAGYLDHGKDSARAYNAKNGVGAALSLRARGKTEKNAQAVGIKAENLPINREVFAQVYPAMPFERFLQATRICCCFPV